jgi:anti-sigma regulatory factor (Ser/Thr protein kinase)
MMQNMRSEAAGAAPGDDRVASPATDAHAGSMTAATGYYRIRFAADPVQLIFFRAGLNAWLRGLRWPEPDRVDAVLAISEACTNAVQHAYPDGEPGDVDVTGRLVVDATARRIVVVVRDEGSWRTGTGGRGYGLTTVHECMADVRIRHDADGTVVSMTSRPVPLLDVSDGGEESQDPARPPARPDLTPGAGSGTVRPPRGRPG